MAKKSEIKCVLDEKALHTVMLDADKCRGCVTCMKRCPTEAIRVRGGKASVAYERCIGCGECIRLCRYQAKRPSHDSWDSLADFKYKIALVAPSFYGQFNNLESIDIVLNGLLAAGFDDVGEVGEAAEYVTDVTRRIMKEGFMPLPIISTACPAILELILMKYHDLSSHLLGTLAPVDVAAKLARERAIAKGVPEEDIGVYFVSPCPAKVFALKMGLGVERPYVDRVLAVSDVYMHVLPAMEKLTEVRTMSTMSSTGLNWGISRGEANSTKGIKTIAADGVEQCVKILEALEDGGLGDIEFIELNACVSGCVGGVMNVENAFVARSRVHYLSRNLKKERNTIEKLGKTPDWFMWEQNPTVKDVFKLDDNRASALSKLMEKEEILKTLPMVDCGLCGAPSCTAFAEDLVGGVIPRDSVCVRMQAENAAKSDADKSAKAHRDKAEKPQKAKADKPGNTRKAGKK